jgi:pilus assembly protein Flp/PilA
VAEALLTLGRQQQPSPLSLVRKGPADVRGKQPAELQGGEYMLEMLMTYVRSAMRREEGQGLVEYALILSLVSIASIAALTALGTSISDVLDTVTGEL